MKILHLKTRERSGAQKEKCRVKKRGKASIDGQFVAKNQKEMSQRVYT